MRDKVPSQQDKNKLRIAKDNRELSRLLKEVQKHLIEGHSPAIYDYLDYQLDILQGPVKNSTKTIDDGIMSSVADMENYFTDAELQALETVDLWGSEYQLILRTAEERNFGWLSDIETRQTEYVFRGEDIIGQALDRDKEEANNEIIKAEEESRTWMEFQINQLKGLFDDAKVNGGDEDIGWMEALGIIPNIIVGIGKLLDGFINLDPEKYIEDNIELAKTQKKLQERLKSEEI